MSPLREKRLRQARALAGLATLGLSLALMQTLPQQAPLPEGWSSPILALEFARTPADLAWLAGPEAEPLRLAFDRGHVLDTAFPVTYAAILVTWGLLLADRSRAGWVVAVSAALACPLDWWENGVLVTVTEALRQGAGFAPLLDSLHLATSLKWGALGVAAAGMAASGERAWVRGLAALVAGLTAVALLTHDPLWDQGMGLAIQTWFTVLIGLALWEARPGAPTEPGPPARAGTGAPG